MDKVGRNEPCPCGSGKKFKQCCLSKKGGSGVKRKLSAKWLNPKQQSEVDKEEISLMERAFGNLPKGDETFKPIHAQVQPPGEGVKKKQENNEE